MSRTVVSSFNKPFGGMGCAGRGNSQSGGGGEGVPDLRGFVVYPEMDLTAKCFCLEHCGCLGEEQAISHQIVHGRTQYS